MSLVRAPLVNVTEHSKEPGVLGGPAPRAGRGAEPRQKKLPVLRFKITVNYNSLSHDRPVRTTARSGVARATRLDVLVARVPG